MQVRIKLKGPYPMNPFTLGKLPESPSARFTINGTDVKKIVRDWFVTLATMSVTAAIVWVSENSGARIVIGGQDYTMAFSLLTPVFIKPLLESLRRWLTNGVQPEPQP
jgi:hypothetical protein